MRFFIFYSVLIFALLGCGEQPKITKTMVEDTLQSIQTHYLSQEIDQMMSYYSNDIEITVTVAQPTTFTQTLSKQTYKTLLQNVLKAGGKSTFDIENLNITFDRDESSAFASYVYNETFEMAGETMTSHSFVQASFSLVDGKPMVTSVNSTEI